jgi:hypothetical protein
MLPVPLANLQASSKTDRAIFASRESVEITPNDADAGGSHFVFSDVGIAVYDFPRYTAPRLLNRAARGAPNETSLYRCHCYLRGGPSESISASGRYSEFQRRINSRSCSH